MNSMECRKCRSFSVLHGHGVMTNLAALIAISLTKSCLRIIFFKVEECAGVVYCIIKDTYKGILTRVHSIDENLSEFYVVVVGLH